MILKAALFAGVVTAFIGLVAKDMQPEPSKIIVQALQDGFRILNSTQTSFTQPPAFQPTHRAIRVSGCFYMSLAFSLMSAAGSMVSKVWCSEYGRKSTLGSPHSQALRRQWHYNGLHKFRYQDLLDVLPVLLYCSIMMFMVAICDYVYGIYIRIAIYLIIFFSCSFVFAVTLTGCSLVLPKDFPYRIPLADVIVKIFLFILRRLTRQMLFYQASYRAWKIRQGLHLGTKSTFSWSSFAYGFKHVRCYTQAAGHLLWKGVCLIAICFKRALLDISVLICELQQSAAQTRQKAEDALGCALIPKLGNNDYSTMEVEALAWLVKSSPVEPVVNNLLKNIPAVVSHLEARKRIFIKNGAMDRLCILFESTFEKNYKGPYSGCYISFNPKKRTDMMGYGFAIFSLSTPKTVSTGLSPEITCLCEDDILAHKILGMALQSCYTRNFFLGDKELGTLTSTIISQSPPVSKAELEMVLALVLKSIQHAPNNQRLVSSKACEILCSLMRIRNITTHSAAYFCHAIHCLLFGENLEMLQALRDCNAAACTYYLLNKCIVHIDQMPDMATKYCTSIAFMHIIQCLCNNDVQIELDHDVQSIYVSFVCKMLLHYTSISVLLEEGIKTLVAISDKNSWKETDIPCVIYACYKVTTSLDCGLKTRKQSFKVLNSVIPFLSPNFLHDVQIAQAIVFYLDYQQLKEELEKKAGWSIYYHVAKLINLDIVDTFLCSTLEQASHVNQNALLQCCRFSKFTAVIPNSLKVLTALLEGGLGSIKVTQFLEHLSTEEGIAQTHEFVFSIIHALCLHPSTIANILSDRALVKGVINIAGSPDYSLSTRKCAASIGLIIWHRVFDSSGWTTTEQKDWVVECILDTGFIRIGGDILEEWSVTATEQDLLWEIQNWLVRLDDLVLDRFLDINGGSTIFNIIHAISQGLPNELQVIWKDKLGPVKYVVDCHDVKAKATKLSVLVQGLRVEQ